MPGSLALDLESRSVPYSRPHFTHLKSGVEKLFFKLDAEAEVVEGK